jgi:hypothetical protein
VIIDTTSARLLIHNIPAGSADLSLNQLVIGSPASPFGLEIVNCDNTIVLDSVQVTTGTGVPALKVDDVSRIAIQSCPFVGDPGLEIVNGSTVYLSRGSVDELHVGTGSRVTYCAVVPGSLVVTGGATTDPLAGGMPNLAVRGALHAEKVYPLLVEADPGTFYAVMYSLRRDFVDLTPVFPIDMVLLLDQSLTLLGFTGLMGPTGVDNLAVSVPPAQTGWGFSIPLQVLGFNTLGNGRMGAGRDVLFLP